MPVELQTLSGNVFDMSRGHGQYQRGDLVQEYSEAAQDQSNAPSQDSPMAFEREDNLGFLARIDFAMELRST